MAAHGAAIFFERACVGDACLGAAMRREPARNRREGGVVRSTADRDAVGGMSMRWLGKRSNVHALLAHLHCAGFLT
ncbi:hypothetical protein ACE8C3_00485 [Xanthomonas euvesicatoria pv. euvesicatoria]|uniref:hypothetical protein n=1 Tax=Xanthomonas euvesicatoria TaxID=456327 RepID=UPI000574E1F5|nr:hypothetical protein [Xanthomonas euvesicatoria]MBZ2850740.1 hypothetical protein [Xanthomonas perforans]KHL63359.1 hypothetical protein XEU66b_02660 [Xanthomonas euvesicatoria]KHL67369.1 hypothetical protein XEU83M_01700 [Xanthomonas euvesicatoria]KLA54248.1 hypothetical protein XEUV683_09025 [Xanthomonas euvesicatoria]KLA56803.1 hypothetical protein XEUV684_16420 [Xanthomonas euvesicatoria]